MNSISVDELKARLDKGENLHLIDVREPHEHAEFNIGGKLFPLGKIQTMQTEEIEPLKAEEVILYCRSGNRSRMACMFLDTLGFQNTVNLEGGMLAWRDKYDTPNP
jgi:rhodanese-related sulfurtransferase